MIIFVCQQEILDQEGGMTAGTIPSGAGHLKKWETGVRKGGNGFLGFARNDRGSSESSGLGNKRYAKHFARIATGGPPVGMTVGTIPSGQGKKRQDRRYARRATGGSPVTMAKGFGVRSVGKLLSWVLLYLCR